MTLSEVLGIPMVQLSAGIEQIELTAHADEGAACLTVNQLEVLFPVEVQISNHVVWEL